MTSLDMPHDRIEEQDNLATQSEPEPFRASELVISLARDIWRLNALIDRNSGQTEFPVEALKVIVVHLQETLEINRIELDDPTGTEYDSGSRYEVAHIEGTSTLRLFIKYTLIPGVKIDGRLLAVPTVVLSSEVS